jgi:hypothetical protein
MIELLFLLVVVWMLTKDRTINITEIGGSKNFHLSDGTSFKMYKTMEDAGASGESLRIFVNMEDRLLEIERISVCSGVPRTMEASSISRQIKERFPAFDFSYHNIHIKQTSEPSRLINKKIRC